MCCCTPVYYFLFAASPPQFVASAVGYADDVGGGDMGDKVLLYGCVSCASLCIPANACIVGLVYKTKIFVCEVAASVTVRGPVAMLVYLLGWLQGPDAEGRTTPHPASEKHQETD
jgi:hypothetical protein